MFARGPFSPSGTSSSLPTFGPEVFGQGATNGMAHVYGTSPTAERHSGSRSGTIPPHLASSISDPSTFGLENRRAPAILIRKLPRNIAIDALRSMLLFAGDLIDTELVRSPYSEDHGFATAVAHFQTSAGALEAQQKLHGKPNTSKDANMIVESHSSSAMGAFERRNTIDGTASRTQSALQSNAKISPPLTTPSSGSDNEFPILENGMHAQSLWSAQSSFSNGTSGHHRVSGKSVINDDVVDEEMGALLQDSLAYAKSGQHPLGRRPTNPQLPVARFSSLSLSTPNGSTNGMASPISSGLTSPRGLSSAQSSLSPMSPAKMGSVGSNGGAYAQEFSRQQLPPVNPADQNPPCNTLYVGNLPLDTSEDELKQAFSKQRGYKRLCFRVKQNGPMCFVEFEDVSFATKALNELYGHLLHNSVKGGIRLSFSKNPLGVRSGQTNGLGLNAIMSPQAMAPGYGGVMSGANYSSISGPPPGLSSPPGLISNGYRASLATGMDGMFSSPFGMPSPEFANQGSPRQYSGGVPPTMGSGTYGRSSQTSYNDYNLGR